MADTDKELAIQWAKEWQHGCSPRNAAVARYILATQADDRDARIAALTQQLQAEENDHRQACSEAKEQLTTRLQELIAVQAEVVRLRSNVERLTKERDEAMLSAKNWLRIACYNDAPPPDNAKPAPHPGDAAIRKAIAALAAQNYSSDLNVQVDWVMRAEMAIQLLAKRALGES